jgi:tRNA nucleotidyltransferase (CCA-adding enzyme)
MHSRSFADDPTRVLRALRFALRFDYEIEEATEGWLREAIGGGYLAEVSGARVRNEIRLSFTENPLTGPLRLQAEGVLTAVHRGLSADAGELQRLQESLERYAGAIEARHDGKDLSKARPWILVLACCAARLPPQGRWELARRLRLSREERAPLIDAGAAWRKAWASLSSSSSPRNSDVERALRPLSTGALLTVAAAAGAGSPESKAIWRYLEEMRDERPQLSGAELLVLGVPEGPMVGELLENLRAARLDGEVASIDDERRMVRAWLGEKPR